MPRRPTRMIMIVIALLALSALACNLTGSGDGPQVRSSGNAPEVEIRVPVNGMSFAEGTNVIVQVVGTDSGPGVSRIELEIDDQPAGSSTAPDASGQAAFIANFEWRAQGIGDHSITAVALRQDGTASVPATIRVSVVQAQPTATPTDLPTATEPPQPTAPPVTPTNAPPQATATPTGPRATSNQGMNVRGGPGTDYPILGSVLAGTELRLSGRNGDGTWFRAPYGMTEGWFFGGLLTTSGDVGSLPVINVPPPPPPPAPPTSIPAPDQPAAPTAVPSGPNVRFWSTVPDGVKLAPGTCVRFFWETSGIKAIYFDGQPTVGVNSPTVGGGTERCPNTSTTYVLRVIFPDDTVHEYSIPVGIQ